MPGGANAYPAYGPKIFVGRVRRSRHPATHNSELRKHPTRRVDGVVDILFAVRDRHKACLKR